LQALLLIQQFSGITILNVYAVKIFNEVFNSNGFSKIPENKTVENLNCTIQTGNSTSSEAYISGISTVLVRLTSSFLLAGLLTKFRRRFMFMTSAFLTITFLVCFATLNYFIQNGKLDGIIDFLNSLNTDINLN
jgi:hypothetical protein